MDKPVAIMQGDAWSSWDAGVLHFNCAVVACYVCQRQVVVLNTLFQGSNAVKQALAERGWALESCDMWACADCKDEGGS